MMHLRKDLSVHEPSSDHTTVVDSTSICSSSNLDSGYGGNFYDSNTNGSPSEKSWYQQSLQSAALKMNATQMLNNHRHRMVITTTKMASLTKMILQ
ncbi:hypothetical protein EB796_005971 [Bugula neritina]|uniref:Uncharacterized protein n=1 Tax=Bugula neritina TaxID=10212 RepID=A0A7J7KDM0_BUGNE|nr:hypothetical protein EB796_005971 [Bugula neritina]